MRTSLLRRVVLASAAFAVAAFLVTFSPVTPRQQAGAQVAFTGYLMVHFTGESTDGEQIYLAHSDDGLRFTDLNNGHVVLRSNVGTRGVRDPALVRSPAGDRYFIIATDLRIGSGTSWYDASHNGSTSLVVWESTDLVSWSNPWLLNVAGGIAGAGDAWAPEAIFDSASGNYIVYWATNSVVNGIRKHRIWYARTSNFRSVSTPTIYIDLPGTADLIDTQIIEVPSRTGGYRYYRASKDSQITIQGANAILGSWTTIGNLSHLNLGAGDVEGPMWSRFNDRNEWALWLDQYATGRGYMPVATTNPGNTQSFRTVSNYDLGGTHKRHGSILNLTAAEESRVLGRWESTPISRIQSYNFPSRHVRHASFDVRIDPNVSPAVDAQFRVVPGLANGASQYVSFESVNFPGYYLRHYGFDFVLAPSDGSSQFAGDATFRVVAGLADSTWSSFQSYNYPSRYIRHYGFSLRLDPISSSVERADATFDITE